MELRIEAVSKTFPANGVVALSDVSAAFRSGAVHAVVGENGAGKSTLMHVVAGYHAPDRGRVELGGREVLTGSTRNAISAGIFMVYQYPQVVGELALWEHMQLSSPNPVLSPRRARREARDLLQRYELSLDIEAAMASLNPSQIYMLGIAMAAESDPRVLILDEPTVGCTDREIEAIFALMRRLADRPAVVVLITHKLRDVFRVAETALIMRKGRVVAHLSVHETSTAEVTRLILGGETAGETAGEAASDSADLSAHHRIVPRARTNEPGKRGEPRLVLDRVGLIRRGRVLLREVSLSVCGGEILGLIGIRENGVDWIEEVVSGMLAPTSGRLYLSGRDISSATPSELRSLGLAYVPTDRLSRGASLGSSVAENLIVADRGGMQRYGVLHRHQVSDYATRRKADLGIKGGLSEPLFRLSGGNIQKVILSRELAGEPEVLVFAEPGWGLDLSSRAAVFRRLRALRDAGTAVLLISTDLDEVLELADRVAVVRDGTVVRVLEDADRAQVGDLMLGVDTR